MKTIRRTIALMLAFIMWASVANNVSASIVENLRMGIYGVSDFFDVPSDYSYDTIDMRKKAKAGSTEPEDNRDDGKIYGKVDGKAEDDELAPEMMKDGRIVIANLKQLCAIGTDAKVTDGDLSEDTFGKGMPVYDENDAPVKYSLGASYYIMSEIPLKDCEFSIPEGFYGSFSGDNASKRRGVYDEKTDTVYIGTIYQLEVLASEDRAEMPVMTGDLSSDTFGMGRLIFPEDGDEFLTYSKDHNYVLLSTFTTEKGASPALALPQRSGDYSSYVDGRDYFGQVSVDIAGETYILIGDRQQLDAINSDATFRTKVSGPVYEVTQKREWQGGPITGSYTDWETDSVKLVYPGDADLIEGIYPDDSNTSVDFSYPNRSTNPMYDGNNGSDLNIINPKRYHSLSTTLGNTGTSRTVYCTVNASGEPDISSRSFANLSYEKDGKYIVFRDINMYNDQWKPLMFTGEMYGVKVNGDGGKLWDDGKTQMNLDTSVKPEIYNINVNAVAMASTLFSDNSSKLDLDVHTGVGFFGTLTGSGTGDKTEDPDDPDKEIYDLVGNLCVVRNIRLRDGSVTNQLTAAKQKETVINFLTGTLGAALDLIVSPLLRRLTGKDDIGLSALTDVLNTRVSNSTNLATGAFAGRIMGNVLVADCEVKDIEVSSVLTDAENPDSASLGTNKPKIVGTGGFVGHAEGATSYEGLSKVLGSVGVILGSTLGIGQFIGFEVSNTYITGIDDVTGYTVQTGANIDENDIEKGDYAGGALGWAAGGDVYDVELNRLGSVSGNNHVGGFAGTTGPGDLVSNDGLNLQLLGISLISANNLLSLLSAERTTYLRANVKGITAGYTVTETGLIEDNATDEEYTAGGFFGDANSVRIVDCHADNLLSVTANSHDGIAGGFVGRSAAGDTADAVEHVDTDDVTQLLALNDLVNAIPLLVPSYDGCDVTYVDGGYVEGDAAGGFTGDFRSGKINTYTMETTVISGNTYTGVNPIDDPNTTYEYECGNMTKPWSVNNIRYVRGGNYGGGWGGHVYPGALASAGGGLSILGVADTSALSATDLLGVADVYIPIIKYAGVHSENGFTVYAAHDESNGTNPATAGYAGGFVGLASVGSVAQIGGSQTNILSLLNVGNIGLLDVFRTYIYRSTVEGVAEGVRVYAHDWQQPGGSLQSTKVTGAAGGFVGGLMSGTIEDCSVTNLNYVEAPNYAAGFCGHSGVKGVLDVSGLEVADNDSILARLLAVLGLDLSAALQLLNIIGSTFERDTVTGYHRPERHCVISGHTGLPSARLFTDLERIVVGDTFTINTLGVVLTYEVDQIVVVNPWESDELRIFSGKDYCTLLTFTPYGVNSHRLLVRGHRIETTEEVAAAVLNVELVYRKTAEPFFIAVGVAVLIIIIAIILVVIRLIVNRKRKKNEKRAQETCADNKSRAGDASDAQESSDGKESE